MPKKVWIKSIFSSERRRPGDSYYVQEGTLLTRNAFEQWNGWPAGNSGRRRRGLKDQWRALRDDLEWMADYIDRMIAEGLTHTYYDGSTEKLIDEFEEEMFYEDLEGLRDSLNETLKQAAKRRPLQRRIELAQQMIDHPRTEPELRDTARNRLEAMKKRLESE